jgi:hypothetical protein
MIAKDNFNLWRTRNARRLPHARLHLTIFRRLAVRPATIGQKQLRGKFEMHTWQDLRDTLGDAYNDALGRLRYCIPNMSVVI